ncbi:MAG: hypothetical protein H5U07_11320 [Candidatus Aminicenantes bacterium]|nr:hypothetical protein [Candidatus Aminicenantes bacterium]
MSLLHDRCYRIENMACLKLADYLERIVISLISVVSWTISF